MSPEDFTSAGHRTIASNLYQNAGMDPGDVDVALIYDHFTPMVLLNLEDYGFVKPGESGPFVAEGNIRRDGSLPVNTHGGNLAEVYTHGMTHVFEAVRRSGARRRTRWTEPRWCWSWPGPARPLPASADHQGTGSQLT